MTEKNSPNPPDSQTPSEPQNDDLSFDLAEVVIPVKIRKKDGSVVKYELHEATEDDVVKWRDRSMSQAQMAQSKRGKIDLRMGAVADSDAYLVSLCLKEITKDGLYSVSFAEVKSWPSRVVKPIFRKLIEISEIDEDEEEAKN